MIFYSNSYSFQSYEVPYDADKNDIRESNWQNYMLFADGPKCGIFTNSVYKVLSANYDGFNIICSDIEDQIITKVSNTIVSVWNDYDSNIGQIALSASNVLNGIKRSIRFGASNEKGTVTLLWINRLSIPWF